jgi:hypothetical protein
MIVICLGYADKRPILYALMKLLKSFGDVAVVTQNRQLLRLLEDRNTSGHFNNIFVAITDSTPDEVFSEIGYAPGDFDHIIFDSIDALPDNYDICIHSRSYGLTEFEKETIGYIDDIVQYNFMYDGKVEKGCINIPVTFQLIKSVEEYEARKLLIPIQCDEILRSLSKLAAPQLKVSERNALKILKKRWNEK